MIRLTDHPDMTIAVYCGCKHINNLMLQGPVVQHIVNLTSLLRGQLVNDFITKYIDIFLLKK